jgi:hypothetical protein
MLRTRIATTRQFAALLAAHGAVLSSSAVLMSGALLLAMLPACASARVFRLNPGEEPERYRVVCRDASRMCERRAKEVCEGDYTVLRKEMSEPEIEEVDQSDLSSSGPSEGIVGWRGEMVVLCGSVPPPLKLERSAELATGAAEAPASSSTAASPSAAASSSTAGPPEPVRVCVPGATQACLGPGACSGAQACLRDASGYGPCDCGNSPVNVAPAVPTASSATSPSQL